MSTKSTLAHGPTFHFYHEALDDSYVYLELESVPFEAGYNRVMVPIPVHIWEVIRQYRGIDLSWAERSDAELENHVTQEVDERIARYAAAPEESRGWISLAGLLAYGSADEPREQQIAQGIVYYRRIRTHQQEVAAAIAELRRTNRPDNPYLER